MFTRARAESTSAGRASSGQAGSIGARRCEAHSRRAGIVDRKWYHADARAAGRRGRGMSRVGSVAAEAAPDGAASGTAIGGVPDKAASRAVFAEAAKLHDAGRYAEAETLLRDAIA